METGVSVAITAAFVWGVYIYLLKREFTGYPPAALVVTINLFALAWYLPVLLTQTDFSASVFSGFGLTQLGGVAITAGMTAAALVLFLRALAEGDVSYVTPINKTVPMFVLPMEIVLLSEILTPIQIVGVVVTTFAVYVANYEGGGLSQPIRKAAHSRPAQLALVSAVCFAVGDLGKRVSLQELAIPETLWVPLLIGTITLFLLPSAMRNPPSGVRDNLPIFVGAGLLVALGEHLTTIAFAVLPASLASPIINTQAIIAVILGGLLLSEGRFRTRLVAAVLAVVGVTLIAL